MNKSVHAPDDNTLEDAPLLMARRPLSVCVPGLTARLRALGICQVQMEYQGADFRGDFIRMDFYRPDRSGIQHTDPAVHSTALQAIFRYLLSQRHPNWIDGYGSAGDFRWDLATDSLVHTHYVRGEKGNERITHHDL